MQTLTIKVDDSYVDQVLGLLQQIPKNKREILGYHKSDTSIDSSEKKQGNFLHLLENGPVIMESEAKKWEQDIKSGYKSWKIETL